MNKKEWNNYFGNIENKYNLKMTGSKPIVIFLDGKDITKSVSHNLIIENKNSFNDIFEQTVKYFTVKLNCMAILGVDEASFIIEDSKKLKEIVSSKKYKAHEIISIFSQCFYKYFNDRYKNAPIYWHCKCSNIPREKIKSYIKFRSLAIYESKLTYFLKRKQIRNAGKIPLAKKEQECNKFKEYENIKELVKGNLYIKGQRIDIDAFLNNQIVELPEIERKEEITFFDINNF